MIARWFEPHPDDARFDVDELRRDQLLLRFADYLDVLVSQTETLRMPILSPEQAVRSGLHGFVELIDQGGRTEETRATDDLMVDGTSVALIFLRLPYGYALLTCDTFMAYHIEPGEQIQFQYSDYYEIL